MMDFMSPNPFVSSSACFPHPYILRAGSSQGRCRVMGLKKWEEDNLGGRWRWKPCTWDWNHTEWTRHGYRNDRSPGWDAAVRVVGVCPGGGATAGPEQGVELEAAEEAIHISSDSSTGYLTNSHWFFLQLGKTSLGLESDQDELKSQDQPKSRRMSAPQSRMKTEATSPGVAVSCKEDRQEEMVDEDETTSATSVTRPGSPQTLLLWLQRRRSCVYNTQWEASLLTLIFVFSVSLRTQGSAVT